MRRFTRTVGDNTHYVLGVTRDDFFEIFKQDWIKSDLGLKLDMPKGE